MLRKLYVALIALPVALTPLTSFSYTEYYDEGGYRTQEYEGDSGSYYHSRRAASRSNNYYYAYPQGQSYYSQQGYYNGGYRHARHRRAYYYDDDNSYSGRYRSSGYGSYTSRLPSHISTSEKTIVVDPNVHAWGAYGADGSLIRAGLATAGSRWCPDLHRPCRTKAGSFRIFSLGNSRCYSHKFPLGRGGAPMPYCMYFNGGQGLHGSHEVAEANLSHGCVRMHVDDAEWIRFNFANVGTKVIVKAY